MWPPTTSSAPLYASRPHPTHVAAHHFELVSLAARPLVDVAADAQLGAVVDEPRQHVRAARDRLLARPPGRSHELVVQGDDAQRPRLPGAQAVRRLLEL